MYVTAVEQHEPASRRIVDEPLAARVLPGSLRIAATAGSWTGVRRWLERGSDRSAPGVWGGVLCRKRYVRDQVREALSGGIGQLVVLGAGLDPLACSAGVPAFEVDMPENVAVKRRAALPGDVRLVPVRFESDSLGEALKTAGFRPEVPAVFVWEAVTQYLTEADVRRTLRFLSGAAAGSRLVFTYVRKDFFDGTNLYGAGPLHRRFVAGGVWHFALDPSEVDQLLREHGWSEREQVGAAQYTERYLRPLGRELAVSEIERFVAAERD
jgi:methyltransferase (TIGR00027 family)